VPGVRLLGVAKLFAPSDSVREFKEDFLKAPGLKLAPLKNEVAYSVDIESVVYFIALDNVSWRHGDSALTS
jgi:hypothetical protein